MQTNTSKAVLITGASSGLGKASALLMARQNWTVFAGVRREADARQLEKESDFRIKPLLLDVTEADQIKSARQQISQQVGAQGLAGLVNNAGIALAGPLEFMPIDQFRYQLEVNLVGQVAVTQSLLGLLRQGKGRIINISSVGGFSASPIIGAYNASKFALEAVSDVLRLELAEWKIPVSVVEPGGIATPIWSKWHQYRSDNVSSSATQADEMYASLTTAIQEYSNVTERAGLPPEKVAEVVLKILTAKKPKTRYLVGMDAHVLAASLLLPDRLRDWVLLRTLRSFAARADAARLLTYMEANKQ